MDNPVEKTVVRAKDEALKILERLACGGKWERKGSISSSRCLFRKLQEAWIVVEDKVGKRSVSSPCCHFLTSFSLFADTILHLHAFSILLPFF